MRTFIPALYVFTLLGCGPLEVRSYTYEGKPKVEAGPIVGIEPTRTNRVGWSEELRHGAPYRVAVRTSGDLAKEAFEVISLSYTVDGRETVLHAPADAPLVSEASDGSAMVVRTPASELEFVEGAEVRVRAEVRLAKETAPVVVERTLTAKKEEKTYSGCQRIAMH